MKVMIARHIVTDDYAHYPGQILIDHPDEKQWLKDGVAVVVKEEPQNARLTKSETRQK